MLKVANSVINASRITGTLPVANGGTGVTTSTGTGNTVLSAAPTLSGDVTLSTGNLVIGTAGKGIDFSTTTSGSGTMTSELLADYEEGTFTPVAGSGVTTNSGTPAYSGFYTKVGRLVNITIRQTAGNITVAIGGQAFTGLPFAPSIELQACSITNGNPDISGTGMIYLAGGAGNIYSGFAAAAQTSYTVTGVYSV